MMSPSCGISSHRPEYANLAQAGTNTYETVGNRPVKMHNLINGSEMYLLGLLVSHCWAVCHLQSEAAVKAKRIINTIDHANRHGSKQNGHKLWLIMVTIWPAFFTYLSNLKQFRHLFTKYALMDGYKLYTGVRR